MYLLKNHREYNWTCTTHNLCNFKDVEQFCVDTSQIVATIDDRGFSEYETQLP